MGRFSFRWKPAVAAAAALALEFALQLGGYQNAPLAWILVGVFLALMVYALLPADARPAGVPQATTRDALNYIGDESRWGKPLEDDLGLLQIVIEFERAARAGEVVVYGRREHRGLHEELPPALWETSDLDAISQLDESAECKTEPKEILPDIPVYVDLRADMRQVKRNWPSPLLTRLTPRFLQPAKRAS